MIHKRFILMILLGFVALSDVIPLWGASEKAVESGRVTLHTGMSKMFYLRDDNSFQGSVREITPEQVVILETADGTLKIPVSEFLIETAVVTKNNDTRYDGEILSEDAISFAMLTKYGEVVVNKGDIRSMDRFLGGVQVGKRDEKRRFFQGDETLTDVFLDPTAFALQERTFYISGLSIGFGFTDYFMLRSRMFNSVQGDINLSPHFKLLNIKRGSSELALGLGGKISTRHDMREDYANYSHFIEYKGKDLDNQERGDPIRKVKNHLVNAKEDENIKVFEELYAVISWRDALGSGRGKWGIHLGAKTNSLAWQKHPLLKTGSQWKQFTPYRVWAATDYDMTKRVKFLVEVFADNGWRYVKFEDAFNDYFDEESPGIISFSQGRYRPVDIDFGFLITPTESFRIGAHFQNPYLIVYWKF